MIPNVFKVPENKEDKTPLSSSPTETWPLLLAKHVSKKLFFLCLLIKFFLTRNFSGWFSAIFAVNSRLQL